MILFFTGWIAVKWRAAEPVEKLTWVTLKQPNQVKQNAKSIQQRMVQSELGRNVERPLPNAFLGAKNQIVDRQTSSDRQNLAQEARSQSAKRRQTTQQQAVFPSLNSLGIQYAFRAEKKSDQDESKWSTPGVRPSENIEGIQQSDRTALNTREYEFYGYFHRIRERLDQAWVPILKSQLERYYRSGRSLASDMSHTTKVLVVLNARGEIIRVEMLSESGTIELDQAAVSAFNEAGPFPNPPKGIIDQNREIKIPWDFILKT